MGRYGWSSRYIVEDCKSISVFWLNGQGYFKKNLTYTNGSVRWINSMGEYRGSIGFSINIYGDTGQVRFQYTRTDPHSQEKEEMDYPMGLVSTPCNFGGKRWWFVCKLSSSGIYCGRRVAKLYLAPSGKYFACRYCYNLTYESCRESHKFNSIYNKMANDMNVPPKLMEWHFKQLFKGNK